MIKINISQLTKENFTKQIMKQFFKMKNGKIIKIKCEKNDKKNKWSITLPQLNAFIRKKLKNFDSTVSLEKLIVAEEKYLFSLAKYIDENSERTKLTPREKDIFLTLYSRVINPLFIKDLNVKVCPYCNRNYILNFNKKGTLNATAQLDHFFDKNKYTYLAVSMYNLIPSCGTCNQRKSTKQENIFYPYGESFNDSVSFSLKGIKNRDKLLNENLDFFDESRIEIEYKIINKEERVKKHLEIFNIKSLYNEHKDIVSELLQKRVVYSDDYIENLLNDYEGKLFNNKEDVLRLLTSGYVEDKDMNKRPLSKLIKDISKDLELI